MTDKDRIQELEDALDHIARVADMASRPTNRLHWITVRAKLAIEGKPFDRFDLPKYPRNQVSKEIGKLKREIECLKNPT